MCGIAGAFSLTDDHDWRQIIGEVVKSQYKRGPDHQGIETIKGDSPTVILGHNRLSIIDLSARSNQPLWDSQRCCCLVFNGEIYNYIELREELTSLGHIFCTTGDSEVIIEAYKEWGSGFIERLNGMFAFALFDKAKKSLLLVRDRFGVKPLYYYLGKSFIVFASTATPLAHILRLEPNIDYVARGLKYQVYEDDSDISPYMDIKALPLSHYMTVKSGVDRKLETGLQQYYDISKRVQILKEEISVESDSGMKSRLKTLLEDSIKIRLRSDVPVGISLSGGLDSSTVAALLDNNNCNRVGFTFGDPNDNLSEGPLVADLSKKLGITVKYISPTRDNVIRSFEDTLNCQDGPFPSLSVVAQNMVFRTASENKFKVLFGGQGADEAFMGYRKYKIFWFSRLIHTKRYWNATKYLLDILYMLLAEIPYSMENWSQLYAFKGHQSEGALGLPAASGIDKGYDPARPLWHRQVHDVIRVSLPTLLRYEDRNSMGNSVESRLPFMDYRLIEFALALSEQMKLNNGYGKWIIREIVKNKIPESIRSVRYKRAFDVNTPKWIEMGLGDYIRARLHERSTVARKWLARGADISEVFSDNNLKSKPQILAESFSLLWLCKNSHDD